MGGVGDGGHMSIIDTLVDDVAAKPRLEVDSLPRWAEVEGPKRKLLPASGRMVDISNRPSTTVVEASVPVTDGELARPWLKRVHVAQRPKSGMAAKRIPWQAEALKHLDMQPPTYFSGEVSGSLAYVDIRGAYASIYARSTLDVHWRPGDLPRLSFGRFDLLGAGELVGEKGIHVAVGGILRARKMRVLDHGRPVVQDTTAWARFLCPDLWGLICWTLHAVAADAVSIFGATYVNKDGYVVAREKAAALVAHIAGEWAMEARVQAEGDGTVRALGAWSIGDHVTRSRTVHGQLVDTLAEVPRAHRTLLLRARARSLPPPLD